MAEAMVRSTDLYQRLLRYASPHGWIVLGAAFGMLLEASVAGAFTWLMQPLLDDAFGARNPTVIAWLPIAILLLFVMRGVGLFIGDYGMAWISRRVIADLRAAVFERYLAFPSRYFAERPAGDVIARLSFQVEQIGQSCTEGIKILVLDSLTILALLAVMAYRSWELTIAVLLMGPAIAAVVRFVSKRYRRISKRIQESVADVAQIGQDVVLGEREIKVYGGQEMERQRFAPVNDLNRRQHLKVTVTNSGSSALVQLLAAGSLALVVWLATTPGRMEGLTPGAFTSFMTAMLAILPSLKRLTTAQALIQRGLAAAEAVFEVLDTPLEQDRGSERIERARGAIRLSGVRVRHPGQERDALDGIDLEINPGEVVALVGRSGSGKTTLVSLLPRLIEPDAGSITLDGLPLDRYSLADLRRQIAFVSQQIVLFNDSVARNIAYGSCAQASRAQIEAAARAAHAWEFVAELPGGLDATLGERGGRLSGGQRQRIAIARALLKDAPILVLDEATSALDNESERLIQDALRGLMRDRSTLVIAHRLSTVEHADRIVVLDQGRIVEQGRHAELLARDGHYAALYRHQLREVDGVDIA